MKNKLHRKKTISRVLAPAFGLALASFSVFANKPLPNIVFFVMDDVGVDQMKLYGYGGESPARLPNIEAIASKGVVFTNTWVMPDCSPSRATFFTGRLARRTHILNPIQPVDLANSQVSPYEMTLPKLLKQKGYISGLIGKMHLSGSELNPETNPMGLEVYRELGFDYFNGYLEGAPLSVDTTAGGVAPSGTFGCGFVPNETDNPEHGADFGACYLPNGNCTELATPTSHTPGRACLEMGGILDPLKSCQASPPENLTFGMQNGYYTAHWVENLQDGQTTYNYPPEYSNNPGNYRGYRSILEADRAIAWINQQQQQDKPWMVSIGFSSAHSPWHNVPESILPEDSVPTNKFNCTGSLQNPEVNDQIQTLMQHMEEGMDHELGRILVETGLANRKPDGTLDYSPEASNTLIVIIGDNGTFTANVKAPFDATRAKGTPYQTGVWVPLIVAGPMVNSPGREVSHMVNGMDLYKLFAEVAGINADKVVPKAQKLDAENMLAYLTNPKQAFIRQLNLTQTGDNYRSTINDLSSPCILPSMNACTSFFPTNAICTKNSGIWYGPGSNVPDVPAEGLSDCCAVNAFLESHDQPTVIVDALLKQAIRSNKGYKLVQWVNQSCSDPNQTVTTDEFYEINNAIPEPLIDTEDKNLLASGSVDDLTPKQQLHYRFLKMMQAQWDETVVESCPGDGNLDLVVDELDVQGYQEFSAGNDNKSSWYDFNFDGRTDQQDLDIIHENFGKQCRPGQS